MTDESKDQQSVQQNLFDQSRPLPPPERFPHNFGTESVRRWVWEMLVSARHPLVVTGYSSLEWVVDLLADIHRLRDDGGGPETIRLLIGHEPVHRQLKLQRPAADEFAQEVVDYWHERGISVLRSSRVIHAMEVLKASTTEVRMSRSTPVHAKIYVGDSTAVLGSSNLSRSGMQFQVEGNVRFEQTDEPRRHADTRTLAERVWEEGADFKARLMSLLSELLSFVPWEEALARACAELLEGRWANSYMGLRLGERSSLWPSQRQGLGQALWVLKNVGSVLVADATGSGKTRLGAHLIRATHQRQIRTGRARGFYPVLICPPYLTDAWTRELHYAHQTASVHSQGMLSSQPSERKTRVEDAIRRAEVLAIDEAHNFLSRTAKRTRALYGNTADHVLLFTATPINRGATDLLRIIDLLGGDNFDDDVLQVMTAVARRRRRVGRTQLTVEETDVVRNALQSFVVRRTKTDLNALIDEEPEAYTNAAGMTCRYPRHQPETYEVEGTDQDDLIAGEIREEIQNLRGLFALKKDIYFPDFLEGTPTTPQQYLDTRLTSAGALAGYRVLASLRSSRAALLEHLTGTSATLAEFDLPAMRKKDTGNILGTVGRLDTPPEVDLDADIPPWLADPPSYQQAVEEEVSAYERILHLAQKLSDERLRSKARVLADLYRRHERIVAFDGTLITLHLLQTFLRQEGVDDVVVATGQAEAEKKEVLRSFALESESKPLIALCSDALSEGVNLQRASAVVQLDLPTVMRIVEQRVGRVDRMDSPHREIEVYWPADSPAFCLRSDELLWQRHEENARLLGANVPLPADFRNAAEPVRTQDLIRKFEKERQQRPAWDLLKDAFFPVREFVEGPDSLVPDEVYEALKRSEARVFSSVSAVTARTAWTFFAVAGAERVAPRWVFVDLTSGAVTVDLYPVAQRVREVLSSETNDRPFGDRAAGVLRNAIIRLRKKEESLLPRRKRRALDELRHVLGAYEKGNDDGRAAWARTILGYLNRRILGKGDLALDLDRVADWWLEVIKPRWYEHLIERRRWRPALLKHIRKQLKSDPLSVEELSSIQDVQVAIPPLDRRIVAAIVGVPGV